MLAAIKRGRFAALGLLDVVGSDRSNSRAFGRLRAAVKGSGRVIDDPNRSIEAISSVDFREASESEETIQERFLVGSF